jgi:hypothetical protein
MGLLADLYPTPGRHSCVRNVGSSEGSEKMNEAVSTRNAWKTVAMMLIAVLVLLVVALTSMLQPAATTGASGPAVHPGVHAMSTGGSSLTDDPYIDRHAEVVATHRRSAR